MIPGLTKEISMSLEYFEALGSKQRFETRKETHTDNHCLRKAGATSEFLAIKAGITGARKFSWIQV